jgi:hypothetical protein
VKKKSRNKSGDALAFLMPRNSKFLAADCEKSKILLFFNNFVIIAFFKNGSIYEGLCQPAF